MTNTGKEVGYKTVVGAFWLCYVVIINKNEYHPFVVPLLSNPKISAI